MSSIPLVDLRAQYESIKPALDGAIAGVMARMAFVNGPEVRAFESEFATYCEAPHAIACANGTDAIQIVLHALGIGAGDEVVTVPHTFISTAEAVSAVGATPVFVDVDRSTRLIDIAAVARAITPRTRAVIPVHLYGDAVDIEALRAALPKDRPIHIIEDAAQAHGARIRGRRVGTLGDAATFSFYPGKNLGAYGDAGAIVTRDAAIAAACSQLRDHGRTDKYLHERPGFNSRLDTIQAAVLSAKLPHLDAWNAGRARAARWYGERLAGVPGITLPHVRPETSPVWHLYVIQHARREAIRVALQAADIGAGVHYPVPLHLQPAYRSLGLGVGSFPVCEALSTTCLSLPMYPELTEAQVDSVCAVVRAAA